jgi:hypothetical protein
VLAEEALNAFVECTPGFVSGNRLSITLKLGIKRSIEHFQFSRLLAARAQQVDRCSASALEIAAQRVRSKSFRSSYSQNTPTTKQKLMPIRILEELGRPSAVIP